MVTIIGKVHTIHDRSVVANFYCVIVHGRVVVRDVIRMVSEKIESFGNNFQTVIGVISRQIRVCGT